MENSSKNEIYIVQFDHWRIGGNLSFTIGVGALLRTGLGVIPLIFAAKIDRKPPIKSATTA